MLVAIRSIDGERIPKMMKWGLIPHWAKDDRLQYSTFNARAEEFTTKPAFRDAWTRGQRCLVTGRRRLALASRRFFLRLVAPSCTVIASVAWAVGTIFSCFMLWRTCWLWPKRPSRLPM